MKILIIGSKGFVGRHVIDYFNSQESYQVTGCDILEDQSQDYFRVDVFYPDYTGVFQAHKFDVCINCSGAANVSESFADPLKDYTLNCVNVYKILETIRKLNPSCRFLNLSSAAVYGNPSSLPIKEDQRLSPLSPYGDHKLQAEIICKEFNQYFNIKTCSVRVFSAYGPKLSKQIFWDIYQKALKSKEITLFGTGNESRDFIYINDLAIALECVIKHADFNAEAYNIASGIEVKISEAANTLIEYLGMGNTINFNHQTKSGDPVNWHADISKLKSFGFMPSYKIHDGLKETAQWMLKGK